LLNHIYIVNPYLSGIAQGTLRKDYIPKFLYKDEHLVISKEIKRLSY